MTAVRAVFLDVDDTLVDYDLAARSSFAATLGADASYEQWLTLDHYERWLAGEFDFQTFRETRMADFLELLGRRDDARDAAAFERRRFDGMSDHYVLFDDVLPCLETLRGKGLLLGLITNNESVHQRAKISTVGLDGLFDTVVISGEAGVAKPDAAIFELACTSLGVAAAEAVHVGDNILADARGANAAGLRGVWLDRRGKRNDETADLVTISGLVELADRLD